MVTNFSITAILVSRFLLKLQEASSTIIRVDHDDPLHFSGDTYDDTPSFIRSLGAVIDSDIPSYPPDVTSRIEIETCESGSS